MDITTTTANGIDDETGEPTGEMLHMSLVRVRGETMIRLDIEAADHLPQYSKSILVRPGDLVERLVLAASDRIAHAATRAERERGAKLVERAGLAVPDSTIRGRLAAAIRSGEGADHVSEIPDVERPPLPQDQRSVAWTRDAFGCAEFDTLAVAKLAVDFAIDRARK